MKYAIITILLSSLMLAACGKQEASFDTQEQARQQVLENATYNANKWRNEFAPGQKYMMRGDSTISPKCITGDGWVTVDLLDDVGDATKQLKCSSVSGTIGCLTVADFKKRGDYASQDGTCNESLPFPLPKIQK